MVDEFQPIWVAGFMSGTSLDAVDGALIRTDGETIVEFGPAVERKYMAQERAVLQAATDAARGWNWAGDRPEKLFSEAREVVVASHLAAWKQLEAGANGAPVALLGVHGQTVLHRRSAGTVAGATLQLMDGPALAAQVGRPVVHDFRSADIAAGGQGAPLAPAYHRALLEGLAAQHGSGGASVVLNLGGVANITARLGDGSLLAFDTGPANGPIDEWIAGHGRGSADIGGRFAAAGRVDEALLARWLAHAWFDEPPPKSLDRYDFNAGMATGLSFEDGAATLTAFSARAVAAGVAQLPGVPDRVIACGGGRHNPALMAMLAEALPCQLMRAEDAGWRGDAVEAEAFAFLAVRALRGLPLSWPGTTGAARALTGGVVSRP